MPMWKTLFAAAILACATSHAAAQTYPARPVTIVVPYAAGGNTDGIARTLAHRLEQRLGQPFVIEQRLGAASVIGATYVSRATPDGHTIMIGTSTTMAVNVGVYKKLPYDPIRDLVPVALVAGVPFVLVVNPALPVKSLADLARYAKTLPDGLTYASNGPGGAAHLFAELLGGELGIKLVHVPYKGLSPALNDIVAGHVQMMFGDFATALPLIKAGKLLPLGVSTAPACRRRAGDSGARRGRAEGFRRLVLADDGRAGEASAGHSEQAQRRIPRDREGAGGASGVHAAWPDLARWRDAGAIAGLRQIRNRALGRRR